MNIKLAVRMRKFASIIIKLLTEFVKINFSDFTRCKANVRLPGRLCKLYILYIDNV